MILSTEHIRTELDKDGPPTERLAITPILSWSTQAKAGQAALDVRLGQRFVVPRRTKLDSLDHLSERIEADIKRYKDEHHVWIGDYFVLHPGQFVLGETLEWIHLPRYLAAYVIGRSSWGRDGLIIATATGVHPGYAGVITLEITNLGEIPIRLYPGLTIAQLFFHLVEVKTDVAPAKSRFARSTAPSSADAARDDKAVVKHLGQERGFIPTLD